MWANAQNREFLMVRVRDVVGSFASPPLLPPWFPLWYLLYYAFKFLKFLYDLTTNIFEGNSNVFISIYTVLLSEDRRDDVNPTHQEG